MSDQPIVNRVAQSGLITINLETYYPTETLVGIDLKDYLFKGLLLREKDFREALKAHDWAQYEGCYLHVYCSNDAIIPVWAYQLIAVLAAPHALDIFKGSEEEVLAQIYRKTLSAIDYSQYQDERVIVKGCSQKPVPVAAYMELTRRLQPFAKSIMYGEACSTVPLFKKKRPVRKAQD